MTISTDKIQFRIRRLPSEVHGDFTTRTWLGEWSYPAGESEAEWLEFLAERCIRDRILEDWYDSSRHSFSVGVADGQVWVVAQVRFEPSDATNSDAYVEQEGRELVGVVQGLIFDDPDWATR